MPEIRRRTGLFFGHIALEEFHTHSNEQHPKILFMTEEEMNSQINILDLRAGEERGQLLLDGGVQEANSD